MTTKQHKFFIILLLLGSLICFTIISTNIIVIYLTKDKILTQEEAANLNADCILILGAGVWNNNQPSHMLEDRLLTGINLYNKNAAPKILVSGDHGQDDYDEVNVMKKFAIDKGIAAEDIFMDHAGFSTYESVYRAKHIFQANKVIIVTQKYHLYRALFSSLMLGTNAYGVSADLRTYPGQLARTIREIPARCKDVVYSIFQMPPTYLGEIISVSGNGNITND